MRIKTLLKKIQIKYPAGIVDPEVTGIACNSKLVQPGYIFVAIKGNRQDGNSFIEEAVSYGARAVIMQGQMPPGLKSAIFIKVKDTRIALADLAAEFYGRPSQRLKVVGVTGTNGKTTITYLIEAILQESGLTSSVVGTINYRFKDKTVVSKNTTPGPIELQSMLKDMVEAGVDYCAMEVSSHALDQDRARGIDFSSAIFTNLTQDHLDYHKTLQRYFKAKSKLFTELKGSSNAIVNIDDAYGKKLLKLSKGKIVTYGIDSAAMVRALDLEYAVTHTSFTVSMPKTRLKISTSLIGRHNIYNILSAIAWAQAEGIALHSIKSAVEKFRLVPGRLERVACDNGFSVFVDYAHTEDALKNIIRSLRDLCDRRIIVVFGCGGERDRTKRPKMGRVVSEMSDYAIITNDNPRSEDPLEIIEDIKKGIKKDNFCVIPERMDAIRRSLALAAKGDIVLVAGKGHEDYQILKEKTLSFDDRIAVKECLKSLN
jgi:UDP-N-acetylmuramoyl-L-alanyl-D-glutamate--2,6-diaminopimelate ligase